MTTYLPHINIFCLVVASALLLENRFQTTPRLELVESYQKQQKLQLSELETRQTNTLVYLESRVNRLDEKLDASTNELHQRIKLVESRVN